ncbi:hypothetical protein ACOMHN_013196 [Nucella lapillus]
MARLVSLRPVLLLVLLTTLLIESQARSQKRCYVLLKVCKKSCHSYRYICKHHRVRIQCQGGGGGGGGGGAGRGGGGGHDRNGDSIVRAMSTVVANDY